MGVEKKHIIIISEPECGAKPTLYAALLNRVNKSALKRHVANGLKEADVEIGDEELADVVDALLKHVNKSALKRHVANGLKEADVEISAEELADVVDNLYDDDYAWYDEILIEVTQLNEA